jgi:hypothetical protein
MTNTYISIFSITENYLNCIEQINSINNYTLIERNIFYDDFYKNKSEKFENIIYQITMLVKKRQTNEEILKIIKNNQNYEMLVYNDILENKIKEIIEHIYCSLQLININ